MDVRTHLRLIWRYRVQIVVLSVVVAGLVFGLGVRRADRFAADARLQVIAEPSSGQPQERAVFLAQSYAELASTSPLVAAAVTASGVDLDLDTARADLTVSALDDLGFVDIRAEADTSTEATRLATAMVDALVATVEARVADEVRAQLEPLDARIAELRVEIAATAPDSAEASILLSELDALVATRSDVSSGQLDRIVLVEPPGGAEEPVSSSVVGATLTALLVALILNAELAVGIHLLADRLLVDDEDELASVTGLPVLGAVSVHDGRAAADGFRELRTTLGLRSDGSVRRIAVVGIGTGSMRTDVSVGLAEATADLGVPVVLVDADLRAPSVHERFDVSVGPGLGDMEGELGAETLVRRIADEPFLRLLTAGRTVDDPGRVISLRLGPVLNAAASAAGTVIVNTPDADRWPDALAIASRCDASVLVITDGARRRATRALADELRGYGANPIGIIVHPGPR